jgi:hypothetical protein
LKRRDGGQITGTGEYKRAYLAFLASRLGPGKTAPDVAPERSRDSAVARLAAAEEARELQVGADKVCANIFGDTLLSLSQHPEGYRTQNKPNTHIQTHKHTQQHTPGHRRRMRGDILSQTSPTDH